MSQSHMFRVVAACAAIALSALTLVAPAYANPVSAPAQPTQMAH